MELAFTVVNVSLCFSKDLFPFSSCGRYLNKLLKLEHSKRLQDMKNGGWDKLVKHCGHLGKRTAFPKYLVKNGVLEQTENICSEAEV